MKVSWELNQSNWFFYLRFVPDLGGILAEINRKKVCLPSTWKDFRNSFVYFLLSCFSHLLFFFHRIFLGTTFRAKVLGQLSLSGLVIKTCLKLFKHFWRYLRVYKIIFLAWLKLSETHRNLLRFTKTLEDCSKLPKIGYNFWRRLRVRNIICLVKNTAQELFNTTQTESSLLSSIWLAFSTNLAALFEWVWNTMRVIQKSSKLLQSH